MAREIQTVVVVGAPARTAAVQAALTGAAQVTVVTPDELTALSADLVAVAGPERSGEALDLLRRVDAAVADSAPVIALDTAAFGLAELALRSADPTRVVGLRISPVTECTGAELLGSVASDPQAIEAVAVLLEKAGRTVSRVGDRPGQVVSALLLPYLNQAAEMFAARYASRDDIDAAMRMGCGLPLGPLQLIDRIGVDVVHDQLDALHQRTGDARHAPAGVLKHLANAGRTGVLAGGGFYRYEAPGSTTAVADEQSQNSGGTAQPRSVSTVGVVGSGTMATGIVEVFAKAGYQVIFVARSQAKVDAARAAITKSLDRAVAKGKLEEAARDETLARITGASSHDALATVDLVVEAVVEDLQTKKDLFVSLDAVCQPGAVLATTTSSLPVVELAAVTARPADVIGVHFFNPAAVMKLVEVVDTVQTAPDVVATVLQVCSTLRKHAVQCGDRAGFIVNALLFPYLNDAVGLLADCYADAPSIDTAITAALGYPMGPFALIDVVGVDVTLAIQRTLFEEFRVPGFVPQPLLEQLSAAGYLGRKTKRGVYAY